MTRILYNARLLYRVKGIRSAARYCWRYLFPATTSSAEVVRQLGELQKARN